MQVKHSAQGLVQSLDSSSTGAAITAIRSWLTDRWMDRTTHLHPSSSFTLFLLSCAADTMAQWEQSDNKARTHEGEPGTLRKPSLVSQGAENELEKAERTADLHCRG